MSPNRPPGIIRPKISTMPRQQSEASCQLELYKLVTEKQRLEHELKLVEQRQYQIRQRLAMIEQHIESTEKKVINLRENSQTPRLTTRIPSSTPHNYQTFYLEY